MATIEQIRSGLIDKILGITNKEFLETLDKLISSSKSSSAFSELSDAQKSMLQMSEDDIKAGNFISQEAMDKRNLEWLNER